MDACVTRNSMDTDARRCRLHKDVEWYPLHRICSLNKCSAVAEMGDRLATIDVGRKEGAGAVPLSGGGERVPI